MDIPVRGVGAKDSIKIAHGAALLGFGIRDLNAKGSLNLLQQINGTPFRV